MRTIAVDNRPYKVRAKLARQTGGRDANVPLNLLTVDRKRVVEVGAPASLDHDRRRTAADRKMMRRAAVHQHVRDRFCPLDELLVHIDLPDAGGAAVTQLNLEGQRISAHPFDGDHVEVLVLLALDDADRPRRAHLVA